MKVIISGTCSFIIELLYYINSGYYIMKFAYMGKFMLIEEFSVDWLKYLFPYSVLCYSQWKRRVHAVSMSNHLASMECDTSHLLGDGDSKSYASVTKSEPYGPGVFIPKEDCIGHVTKRMGTALKKVLTDYKGNIISLYKKNILCYLLKHYEYVLYPVKYLKFTVVLFFRTNF